MNGSSFSERQFIKYVCACVYVCITLPVTSASCENTAVLANRNELNRVFKRSATKTRKINRARQSHREYQVAKTMDNERVIKRFRSARTVVF